MFLKGYKIPVLKSLASLKLGVFAVKKHVGRVTAPVFKPVTTKIQTFFQHPKVAHVVKKVPHKIGVIAGAGVVGVLILAGVLFFSQPPKVAAWFDYNWAYRVIYVLTNSGSAIATQRKLLIEIDTATLITAGKLQSDCDDARFTDQDGKILEYFIDTNAGACNTSSTDFYVKVTNVPTNKLSVYFYYGNPSAPRTRSADFFAIDTTGEALVAYYKMDEASANTCTGGTNDSCDYALTTDGAWNGNVTNTTGKINNGTTYDGTGDYIAVADTANNRFDSGTQDFSISVFIKTSTNNKPILDKRDGAGDGYYLSLDSSGFAVFLLDGKTLTGAANLADGNWHLITVVIDRDGNGQLYADGATDGSAVAISSEAMATTATLTIGANSFAVVDYWNGQLDELRLYAQALSAAEVLSIYNANNPTEIATPLTFTPSATSAQTEEKTPGPVGVWNFDEASGSTTYDSSAQANNGTFATSGSPLSGLEQEVSLVNNNYTSTATTYAPTDNALGLAYYDSSKYTSPAVYFEAVVKQNQTDTTSNAVGFMNAIDCPATDDCKIAFYDATNLALRFADCADATCNTSTITVLDGDPGCSITNCDTAVAMGDYIAIKCPTATDCKIAYRSQTQTDTFFIDCDNATCTSGTRTLLDGVAGCALTGCANRVTGYNIALDCSAGATDCKIISSNSSGDIFFSDCDSATCGSGTVTTIDGAVGCTLTGCNTSQGGVPDPSIYCVSSTDCKVTYGWATAGDLVFADCDNATCTSGTATMVDGGASCPLTGCSTSDSVGTYTSIDCTGGASDCKIAYHNGTDADLYFADCDSATCSSGTTTLLDGSAGCVLTGCSTASTTTGIHLNLDCTAGATDCKIGYSFEILAYDAEFADCDNATCSSGTLTKIDGGSGCTLTNCETAILAGQYSAMDCVSATDCKIAHLDNSADDLKFADCDNATCTSGTATRIDGDGVIENDVGSYMDVDCTAGAADCKIAYYDATALALVFKDCDDIACSTGTITILDGTSGCSLTNCTTSVDSGKYVSLDCIGGSSDCKISYLRDGGSDDLYFADCDSTTCNVGTATLLDGAASCTLTGCSSTLTGASTSLDCSAGATDCKISYYNYTGGDLYFADCDSATCSSGTRTLLDGNTGCVLTGCATSIIAGYFTALDCPSATDCKISYYNLSDSAQYFADCDSATCSSGNISKLDGIASCVLTGCQSGDSVGATSSIDCPATDDCKISYYNATDTDLYFVDCDSATCGSGTTTFLDGNTGCALTGCGGTTTTAGAASAIDCSQGATDCKIVYTDSLDAYFADCDSATCGSGTTTLIDGNTGCALTGCITGASTHDGAYAIDCSLGATDCKVTYYESVLYNNIYFGDCGSATCGSGTTTTADDGSDRIWAQLVSSAGAPVVDAIVTTQSNSYTRLRTAAISPTTATSYGIRLKSTDSTNITADLIAARMIITQSGTPTASLTQVEVGNKETTTSTSYTPLTDKKIYRYDTNKFTPTPTIYFEATLSNTTGGQVAYAALYTDGATCSTVVSGSEVTVTGTTWTRSRSSAITLTDDTDYTVCIKAGANTTQIANARIILEQSSSISAIEVVKNLVNTGRTDTDSTYTSQNGLNYFDPAFFAGATNYYFESDLKTSAGTGYAQFYNTTDAAAVSSSEVTTTGTTYSRQRSNAVTMPVAAKTMDAQLKNSASNTTTASSADLIIQAGTAPASSPTRKTAESCYSNNCIEFNGSDNSITVTNATALDLDKGLASGITFAAWVKVNSDGENSVGQIFNKGSNTYLRTTNEGVDRLLDLEASLDLATSDATVSITNGLPLNEWHHVALTYTDDGDDEVSLYIDGRLRGTSTGGSGAPASDSNDLTLGGSTDANFHGLLDEIRVYPYERTLAQIQLDYNARGSAEGVSSQMGGSNLGQTLSHGLVAYYPMDESAANSCTGGSNDICDHSGNNNDGAWNGNATTATGKFGNGTTYDGTGDYTQVADSTSLDISSAITVASWVKIDTLDGTRRDLITKVGAFEFRIHTDNTIRTKLFGLSDDFISGTGTTLTTGTWYHLAATYDGQTMRTFVNGRQDLAEVSSGAITATANALFLGSESASAVTPFDGSLDDARIYNRALSPDEVKDLYNFAPGPVAHWKLDENTGTSTVSDSSTHANTGTMTGTMTASDWVSGKLGSALDFDGTDDAITIATASDWYLDFAGSEAFSGGAWVYITAMPGSSEQDAIIAKYDQTSTLRGYRLVVENDDADTTGNFQVEIYDESADQALIATGANDTVTTNTWYYIYFTFNGGTAGAAADLKLYTNAAVTNENSANASFLGLEDNAADFTIGDYDTTDAVAGNTAFTGKIDEIRMYNYARTPSQIIEDMNGGHPVGGSPIGSQVAYWKFDEGGLNMCPGGTNDYCDTSINANDLTFSTTTGGFSNDGKFGKAFNGLGTVWASRSDDADLDFGASEDASFSLWFRSDSVTNPASVSEYLLHKLDSGIGYRLSFNTSGQLVLETDDDGSCCDDTLTSTADYYDATWHHVVAIRDITADKHYFYLDGQLIATDSDLTATSALSNAATFYVGDDDGDSPNSFAGDLDELKVYRGALTQDQVRTEYTRGSAAVFGSTSTASNGITPDNSSAREYCVPGDTATCNAPVAEWKLDENTGTTAYDTSGNANVGTFAGGPTWATGKLGSAVSFDGSGDYIDGGTISQLDSATQVTICGWIYRNSTSNLVSFGTRASTSYRFNILWFTDDKIYFQFGNGAPTEYAYVTLNGTGWHHVCSVFNGSLSGNSRLLGSIDGVSQTLSYNGTPPATLATNVNQGAFIIGRETADRYTTGLIDQVHIYNYVRTPAQIAWEYNRGAAVAHYKLDECQGATAYNSAVTGSGEAAGNNSTITIGASGTNTATGSCKGTTGEAWKDGATGKVNASLELDGTDDYAQTADTSTLRFDDPTQDFSLFAWVKRTTTGTEYIISKEDADNDGYRLQFNSSNQVVCSQDATDVTSTLTITDTSWHHVGCIIDRDGNGQMYIDGTANGTAVSMGSDAMATTSNITIGTRSYSATSYLSGQVDDVRIYNFVVTAAQVKTIYNGGAVNFR